ncbi:MAG: helix-turn-helix transcriptional regulator [Capnocytophaga sp.]|nr:helix-turn-helix transcriptional regulator [Capnocytophaga sp.]
MNKIFDFIFGNKRENSFLCFKTIISMKRHLEIIKEARKARGYSQEAVAINLGITQGAYAKIEKGDSPLSIRRLHKLCDILELSVKDVFSNQEEGFAFIEKQIIEEMSSLQKEIDRLKQQLSEKDLIISRLLKN